MKKSGIVVLFLAIFAFEAFCSYSGQGGTYRLIQANKARIIAEIETRLEANGCGAYGWPKTLVWILDVIGDQQACFQHDIDYATLGMSREEADKRLHDNMYRRVYESFDTILAVLKKSDDFAAQSVLQAVIVIKGESARILLATIIAEIYTFAVRKGAGNAYEKAQADARAYKERTGRSYYPDRN